MNIFKLVFIVITILLATSMTAFAETKTVVLDVPGMTCKFCPITIKKALKKIHGVVEIKSDYDSKTATVTYDADKTNTDSLTKATANAGYPSTIKDK